MTNVSIRATLSDGRTVDVSGYTWFGVCGELCDACWDEYGKREAGEPPAWDEEWLIDGAGFADPGGGSALRAATKDNPRNLPCPTCGAPDRLTPLDRANGYQCDSCADRDERG